MTINANPTFAWGQDLTPEQLARIWATVPDDYKPGQLSDVESWVNPDTGLRGGDATRNFPRLDGGAFMQWFPQFQPGEFTGDAGGDWVPAGDGIGNYAITQNRNESTWGNNDIMGGWDPDTGKWQGFGSNGPTVARGLANFIATAIGGYYAAGAMGGDYGTMAAAAGKGAVMGVGMNTIANEGDTSGLLGAAATGAVSGAAGGAGQALGWNPAATGALVGGGTAALRGGDGSDILQGAAAGGFSGYGNSEGFTGNSLADRAIVAGGSTLIRGGDGRDALINAGTAGLNNALSGSGNGTQQQTTTTTDTGGNMENQDFDAWLQEQMDTSGRTLDGYNDGGTDYSNEGRNYVDPNSTGGSPWNSSTGGFDWGKFLSGMFGGGGGQNGGGNGWGALLPMILGGIAGAAGGKDSTNSSTNAPWEPATPFLTQQLAQGQGLSQKYQDQPFSQAQQTAYGNVGGLLDALNHNAGGLLQGFQANANGGNQFVRGQQKPLTGAGVVPGGPGWTPWQIGDYGTRK